MKVLSLVIYTFVFFILRESRFEEGRREIYIIKEQKEEEKKLLSFFSCQDRFLPREGNILSTHCT